MQEDDPETRRGERHFGALVLLLLLGLPGWFGATGPYGIVASLVTAGVTWRFGFAWARTLRDFLGRRQPRVILLGVFFLVLGTYGWLGIVLGRPPRTLDALALFAFGYFVMTAMNRYN
ncbi:MAG: hypothetical protein ACO1SV_24755 [Fimbriimonas sp.]